MFCKLVLPSKEVHKLSYLPETYENLHETVSKKFFDQIPKNFLLKYQDSDNEYITISNTEDLKLAISSLEGEKQKTLRIYILPPPELSSTSKQNIKFDPLPGIPEAVEQSVSSLNELSLTSPAVDSSTKQPLINLASSYSKFDFDQIPRTQSVILDDVDSADTLTPGPEKLGEQANRKRFFTFSGTNSIDLPNSQYSKNLQNSFLSEQKVKLIEDLIESKINQTLQDKLQGIIHQLALRYYEECNMVSPASSRASSYQCGVFPRMIRPSGRRHTIQAPKGYAYKGPMCAGCAKFITGIKYFCLTCPDYACCEECEETQNHAHPLLKIRPAKQKEEVEDNLLELIGLHAQSHTPDVGMFGGRAPGRHCTVNPSLMSMNSMINLPEIYDQFDRPFDSVNTTPTAAAGGLMSPMAGSGMCARRGFSMGCNGIAKLGRNCESDSRYKACISKLGLTETINMKPGATQHVKLSIKNTGDSQWHDSVKLICINGIYKENEVSVPALMPGEETTVTLPLIAPNHSARFLSQWKLHHFESGFPKQFGKAIFVDIEVNEKERQFEEEPLEENEECEEREEEHGGRGKENVMRQEKVVKEGEKSLQEPDKKLMKEMECCEEVLSKAKTLNDMFPGDIKEKIEFLRGFPESKSINDIVSSYLAKMSNTNANKNKKRLTWSNSMRISTLS